MERDSIIGCIALVFALGFVAYLTIWSRRTINWIARNGKSSVREILKDLNGKR